MENNETQVEQKNEKFLTPSKFELIIDKKVSENGQGYIEAIVEYCDENLLDYSEVAKYVSKNLRKKVEEDAVANNYFPRISASLVFEEAEEN